MSFSDVKRICLASALSSGALCAAAAFRPPAVPLAVNDPYLSLWSPADRLTDAETMHWSRDPQPLSVLGEVGGRTWRFCGKEPADVPAASQVSLKVGCTETVYSFDAGGMPVEVRFSTPLLPGRWDVFSRPVTYLTVKGAKAKVAISPAFATDDDSAEMVTNRQTIAGHPALSIGRKDQKPHEAGDRVRADAGWMWLVDAGDHFLLAYDSVTDISFLGREAPAWWRRGRPFGTRFDQMLAQAVEDYPQLMREMADFDARMRERFVTVGGEKYAAMAELAWRQGFGACRLATAENGDMLLFSKENTSNGCIGTVDILYPQLPHLMLAGVELLKAAIRPDMLYAVSGDWPYPYAPHDLGKFPKADRQVYGMGPGKTDADRMPVEESGNLIIALYAVARMEGHSDFAGIWWPTVRQWAEYLRKFGFDPENQLCTDDFAGHLAHNANLSIKSIVAFEAFSRLADMRGDAGLAREFHALAVSGAAQWTERAQGGKDGATCLAFGERGTWSLKYNLALAKTLRIDLFPSEIARREVAAYLRNADRFGTPLDCREHWCKVDWLFWVATLAENRRDFEALTDPVYDFLNATEDRVAFPDLYYTKTAKCTRYGKGADQFIGFNARPVIGGIYLPVLRPEPNAETPTTDGTALVGLVRSGGSPAAALQRFVDRGEIAGAVSMVAVSGRVETASVGLADPTTGRPFDAKTLFWIASMTKGFCGAAVMSCVDRGLLNLDDPIEKYIPEISNVHVEEKGPDGKAVLRPPKAKMTLRMCLSHVAGYPFSTPLALKRGSRSLSMEEHVKGAVECPLLRDPLVRHQYSNVDINLAGRVVEIVTGMPFEDYLQKTFFDPLDMKDITFYPTAEQMSNKVYVARVKDGGHYEDGREDEWAVYLKCAEVRRGREHAIAAGGLYSTAADVMKFYLMLANDGKAPDGTRILSHASIVELSRAQYPELDRYTLGMRQFGDWFGHDGALQTEAYANWKENRAALLFVQVVGTWRHPFKTAWRSTAMGSGGGPRLAGKIGETHAILRTDSFYGYDRTVFDFEGYEAWVVEPKAGTAREGFPWTWTMQWATAFVPRTGVPQLLSDGYHHATIITFRDKMDETGLAVSARFQRYLVDELGLAPKADLIGMSWGGFFSTRYAANYPENVDKIYLDAPLLCFKDGKPKTDIGTWAGRIPADGCWKSHPEMPVNLAERLARTGIPVFLVYGGQDDSCPPELNAIPFIERYEAAAGGKSLKVLSRPYFGHHPHGFDPGERTIVDFFEQPFVPDAGSQDILGNTGRK